MACEVKSFTMEFQDWNISWPTFWSDKSTIRLPVKFRLELQEGSSPSDCWITQLKMGRTEQGRAVDDYPTWERDDDHNYWWDGSKWNAANGSWSGNVATFRDEPGFNNIERNAFPVYWGGIARAGFFEFRTIVVAAADGAEVASLNWSMLINVRAPERGGFFLDSCTEDGDGGIICTKDGDGEIGRFGGKSRGTLLRYKKVLLPDNSP